MSRCWTSHAIADARREDAIFGKLQGEALERAGEIAAESLRIARNSGADTDLRLIAVEDMLTLARRGVPIRDVLNTAPRLARWLGEVAADPRRKPMDRIRAAEFLLAGSVLGWWTAPHIILENVHV